ncbi:hypothetical protein J7J81_02010 [bacterium]|nr:hypothetical protein [bacterium]
MIEVKRETKKVFQGKEGFATLSAILVMAALVGCVLFFYHTSIVERAFFSPSLEGNKMGDSPVRKVTIALPPDYYLNPTKHYPVVYYLAGFGANNETDINWIGKENVVFYLDSLMAQGLIQDLIIVCPDPKNSFGGSFYTNSLLTGNWEDYIVKDLVYFIDNHYRTIASKNGRAICGFSMGGYGALMLAMKYPNVFGIVASFNAPLDLEEMQKAIFPKIIAENPGGIRLSTRSEQIFTPPFLAMAAAFSPNLNNPPYFLDLPLEYPNPEPIPSVWKRWLEHDPANLAAEYVDNLRKLKIYIGVDKEDKFQITAAVENFHRVLVNLRIKHKFLLYPGGHEAGLRQFMNMLEFLSSSFENK